VAQRTPDLSGPITEAIAGAGWNSGNALALIVTGTGKRVADAFEDGAARAPLLHVEYTVPVALRGDGDADPSAARIEAPAARLAAFVAPSPLDGVGTLHLELPRATEVRVRLYDVGGRRLRTLLDGAFLAAGRHRIGFDPRDPNGRALAAGVYFLLVEAGGEIARTRVTIVE
jgi:hypothetical protein